jgi:hypothetical protein
MNDSSSAKNATSQLSTPTPTGSVQATRASDFVNSIGVNTHIDSGKEEWENTPLILNEIEYLGVTHVRDGTPYSWALSEYVALAQIGVKFDLLQVNPVSAPFTTVDSLDDVQRADTLENAAPGSVQSLEGANEYNINSYNLNGVNSYGNIAWGALDDQNLQAAVEADPTLAGVTVVAASTSGIPSPPNVSEYVGASNWHAYAGVGDQLNDALSAGIAAASATAPGAPVYVTETGISSSGYGTASWGVTDEATQGIIDANALLDSYNDGAAETFIYILMDETQGTPQSNQFGLFQTDGTPKPAATDIHNLTSLLSDNGTTYFDPGTLSYSISGLPSTASSMLLEKSDGTFDIVVWNGGATLYNGSTDVVPSPSPVNVSFGSNYQSVNVYDPIQGVTALETKTDVSTVSFDLSADPIIVEIAPNTDLIACFGGGTLIGTPAGEVQVEKLNVGDMVLTLTSGPREIRWIGKGKVVAISGQRTPETPVIIHKHAIEANVPNQDLHLTKAPGRYLDGVLIPVEFLVNHRSIVWDDRAKEMDIYHIELDSHDVLVANGVPAESYRDDGNRFLFHNASSGWGLPPQVPFAPVETGGPVVDRVWKRLLERAGPRNLPPMTDDPNLQLIVDGEPVTGTATDDLVKVFRLGHRPKRVILASREVVPAEIGFARDPRSLGVALRRLEVRSGADFMIMEADDPRLEDGFHYYEAENRLRWTDGYATLPVELFAGFDGCLEVVLTLAATTRYPDFG